MKILLDENIPKKLKIDFGKNFNIKTVQEMKWQGKKNGELLELMTLNGFDGLITIDKNLKFQQNLKRFDVKIIILNALNNKHQTLQKLVPKIKDKLVNDPERQIYEVTRYE